MTKKRNLTIEEYVSGVLAGERTVLARAITLVESNDKEQLDIAQEVIRRILPSAGKSMRIGVTGVPGVGKSTFIEGLGNLLCEKGHRVAILAIDPSSVRTQGSILGDKVRMEKLGRRPNCFIRPSPSRGVLGGVNCRTRESVLVCEAAGFDTVLVETVGVGQSESAVRTIVDFLLLLVPPIVGDELQNIKKGVIELADAILVNKADGANQLMAGKMQTELSRALQYLTPATEGWKPAIHCVSSVTGEGIAVVWGVIERFRVATQSSGSFYKRRNNQLLDWLHETVIGQIRSNFFENSTIASILPEVEHKVTSGVIPVKAAVDSLLDTFYRVQR